MNLQQFNSLLKNIQKSKAAKISRPELICITQLVFYSGVLEKEINGLQVSDVIDAGGNVKDVVKSKKVLSKKSKGNIVEIILTVHAKSAIDGYLAEMKQKNPTLVMKRKPLFPSYNDNRKLRRHWKDFSTNFTEIRQGGMKFYYTSNISSGTPLSQTYLEGGELFRVTPRDYYAVVSNKKIRSGKDVHDEKQIDDLLKQLENAERIGPNSPMAQSQAAEILHKANKALAKIINHRTRRDYASIVSNIAKKLASHIPS
jgi:hypothetical protein